MIVQFATFTAYLSLLSLEVKGSCFARIKHGFFAGVIENEPVDKPACTCLNYLNEIIDFAEFSLSNSSL